MLEIHVDTPDGESHSLRSAWIEMRQTPISHCLTQVALLTECVDRNFYSTPTHIISFTGRTPYGVRG